MKRRLRRIGEAFTPTPPDFRVENPELFPAWVWCRPPDDWDAPRKRGGPLFEEMARLGFRVDIFPPGPDVRVPIRRPWTYLVLNVPAVDWTDVMERLSGDCCSVIMDCHFPIMNMEQALGTDQQLINVIDNKDVLLANLALADAVTVPRGDWAADLAEINPNVFVLPDYTDATAHQFGLRLAEIAQASANVKRDRQITRKEMGL